MKLIFGALLIGLLVSVAMGAYQPSSASLSDLNVTTLVNVVADALIYCGSAIGNLVAIYQDFMGSNKIMFFLKSSLPPELPPSTIPLLGSGFVGLVCYRTWRRMK